MFIIVKKSRHSDSPRQSCPKFVNCNRLATMCHTQVPGNFFIVVSVDIDQKVEGIDKLGRDRPSQVLVWTEW